jgi:hypothetical protein
MKTMTVNARSRVLNELLKLAQESDVILQLADGSQFLLSNISGAGAFGVGESDELVVEIQHARKNNELMKFLDQRGGQAKNGKGIPLAEVRRQLGL